MSALSLYTLTIGDQAENHRGMEQLGELAEEGEGFNDADLRKIVKKYPKNCVYIELDKMDDIKAKLPKASILVIKNGVDLLGGVGMKGRMYAEQHHIQYDKQALMYGRVCNKYARHNVCFDDFSQEPDIEKGKGRVIDFKDVPLLSNMMAKIVEIAGEKADNLKCEGNHYYDVRTCGIGFHGDSERRKVIGIRLGAPMAIQYQWFLNHNPVGKRIEIPLGNGDIYFMSEKTVGTDWKKSSIYTLRHGVGSLKFLNIKPNDKKKPETDDEIVEDDDDEAEEEKTKQPEKNEEKINEQPLGAVGILKPTTFEIDDAETWKEHLDREGFVVLKEAVSPQIAENAINMFLNELHTISPDFDPEKPKTWTSNNTPIVWGKGSATFKGMGQSDSNWLLRTQSKTRMAFAMAYQVEPEELATSFDGFSLFVDKKQKSEPWPHQDQRVSDKRLSIQGILNLLPCGELDAGFVCVPKSHIEYNAPDQKTDWVKLPEESSYNRKLVKLIVPERSLILFNSKLIHANTGMSERHPSGQSLNRISAYLTFGLRERQTEEVRVKRIEGYYTGNSTSHWVDRYEEKKLPFHIAGKFKKYTQLKPRLDEDGSIPEDRLEMI